MILPAGHSTKYLADYRDGKIAMGLGLDCELDNHLRFKRGQLNMFLGHDNVGKSYFMKWYFLALATNHGLTFCLFMDEDYHGKVMRDLVQMYTGKSFMDLHHKEIRRAEMKLEMHFKFIDNQKRYEPKEITSLFLDSDSDVLLIDPWNALKMDLTYGDNYNVLNELKMITKNTNKTIYVNLHPNSASGRLGAVYPKDHIWAGQVRLPLKSDAEGGKAFANKADDFVVIHRLISHPDMWMKTLVEVVKVKDVDTGGKPTLFETPVLLDYNFGRGFLVGSSRKDVIKRPEVKQAKIEEKPVVEEKPNLEPTQDLKNDFQSMAAFRPDFDNQLPLSDRLDPWDELNTKAGF
jgi:hypothetical protein